MHKGVISNYFEITIIKSKVHPNIIDNKPVLDCNYFSFQIYEEDVRADVEQFDLMPETFLDIVDLLQLVYLGTSVVVLDLDVVQAEDVLLAGLFAGGRNRVRS